MTRLGLSARALSLQVANLELVWSSTTLGTLKECPRKYQLSILEGYTSRGENIDINFGWLYHGALEHYQKELTKSGDTSASLIFALRWLFTNAKGKLLADPTQAGGAKSFQNLVRSVIWHTAHYEKDSLTQVILADGTPAVELSFVIDSGMESATGEQFQFSGHLDRLVYFNGQMYWHDYKTTKTTLGESYFDGFSPDNQATLYTLASKTAFHIPSLGGIIDAAQIAVGFTRFGRKQINRTPAQVDEWLLDTKFWLSQAELYAYKNYWPMNDKACFRCSFRSICSKDPRVRTAFLDANFGERNYDPLEIRK